jgi:hypothetical protein
VYVCVVVVVVVLVLLFVLLPMPVLLCGVVVFRRCSQAVFLNTLCRRYGHIPQIDVDDQALVEVGSLVPKPSAFLAAHAPATPEKVGVNPGAVTDRKQNPWATFSPKGLNDQFCLVRALLVAPRDKWDRLWIGEMLRLGMIWSTPAGEHYCVVSQSSGLVASLGLIWNEAHYGYTIDVDRPSLIHESVVCGMDEILIHSHGLSLAESCVLLSLDQGVSLLEFTLLHTIHLFSMTYLRKVSEQHVWGPYSSTWEVNTLAVREVARQCFRKIRPADRGRERRYIVNNRAWSTWPPFDPQVFAWHVFQALCVFCVVARRQASDNPIFRKHH